MRRNFNGTSSVVARRARRTREAATGTPETLETRRLLAVDPVIVYSFDDASDTGTHVEDVSTEGSDNDGTLKGDNAGPYNTRDPDTGELTNPLVDDPTRYPTFMPAGGTGADGPSPAGGKFMRFTGDSAFNGAGGRVQTHDFLGGIDAKNNTQGPMSRTATLGVWMRTTSVGTGAGWQAPGVTGAEHQGDGQDIFWNYMGTDGRVRGSAGDEPSVGTLEPANTGEWVHVAMTRNHANGRLSIYLNGALQGSINDELYDKQASFNSIGAIANIRNLRRVDGFAHFNGDMDQVEIFDRELDPVEIAQRYGPTAATPPAAPTGITGVSTSPAANTITFTPSAGATGYLLLRSPTGAPGTFTQIAALPVNATGYTDTNVLPGQTHFYQIQAINAAGTSTAAPTPALSVTTLSSGPGARGSYFNDHFWGGGGRDNRQRTAGGIATFRPTTPDVTQIVADINFDWGTGTPHPLIRGDNHSTLFTGKITIPLDADGSGTNGETIFVTFVNSSDDDGIIFVNGVEAANDMGPPGHGQQDRPGTALELVEGQSYNFSVWQAEQGGGSGVRFKWLNPATGASEAIPGSLLTTAMDVPGVPTLSAPSVSDVDLPNRRMVTFTVTENATNSSAELWFELLRDGVVVGTSALNYTDADETAAGIQTRIADSQPVTGTHSYTIRARNFDGVSAESAAVSVTVPADYYATPANGASAYYFNSASWNGGQLFDAAWGGGQDRRSPGYPDYHEIVSTIDFNYDTLGNSPVPTITDPVPLFPIQEESFSTVFTGEVLIPSDFDGDGTPGETIGVQFVGNTDDHGIYYVNGQLAAISYIPRGQGDYMGAPPLNLVEGQRYDFVILQAEQFGGAGVHFKWINPTAADPLIPEVIPTENLFPLSGAPAAPGAVTGTGGGNAIALAFTDNATNEVSYLIERSVSATGPWTVVGRAGINSNSFVDTTVTPNTNYFYRVTATNYEGVAATISAAINSGAVAVPAAPTVFTGVPRFFGPRIGFTDASTNETQFLIQRKLSSEPDTAYVQVGTVAGNAPGTTGGDLYFQDVSGLPGQTYVYRVIASNAGGNSAPSNAFTLANNVGAGTGFDPRFWDERFTTREQFDPKLAIVDPLFVGRAAETFGAGDTGPAGLNGGGGGGSPDRIGADTFSGQFTGYWTPEFAGPYTFLANSDDGVSLQITDIGPDNELGTADDVVIVDHNILATDRGMGAGFVDTLSTVTLTPGRFYYIDARFQENGGGAGWRYGYRSRQTGEEAFPTESLFPTLPGAGVSEVYARGSAWTTNFKTYMEGQGLGDDVFGYRVDNKTGDQQVLPWTNVNEIVLRYSAPPTGAGIPTPGTVTLTGDRAGGNYTVTAVNQLDPQTFVLVLDRALGNLSTGGENGVRVNLVVPGGGSGGGSFSIVLRALQGDVNHAGETTHSVVAADFSDVKNRFFRTTSAPGPAGPQQYTVFHDVDGSGGILANDFSFVKARFFDSLQTTPFPVSALTGSSITEELFASGKVIG